MKKLLLLFFTVISLTLQNSLAGTTNYPTVQEQLEALNINWKGKNLDYSVLRERIPLTNDVSLIQMHLSLVEKTLRDKNLDNLTAEQKLNRNKCLNILHSYSAKGVFPKNLYHSERTPYFIDKFGTACAVGQLIISTGYNDFAEKVKEENNNAYISELTSIYPEINEWASKFGFTTDELAWIQPCYCSMPAPGTVNVSCYGGYDGYFMPAASGGTPPYTYTGWYWWDGSSWLVLPCGGCDLIAGDYKCVVTDGVGVVQEYFATITQPSPITQTISYTNDNGFCDGTAIVMASGGTPGYTYLWTPAGYTNDTVTGLCQNSYTVTITDNNGCTATETITISLATKIDDASGSEISIFPNPVSKEISFKFGDFFHPNETYVSIYNSLGQKIIYKKVESPDSNVDLRQLDKGVYLLRINNGTKIESRQFIKNE